MFRTILSGCEVTYIMHWNMYRAGRVNKLSYFNSPLHDESDGSL